MTFTGPSALLGRTPLRRIADGSEFPRNHRNITMSLGAIVQRIDGIARPNRSANADHDSSGAYADDEEFPDHAQFSASARRNGPPPRGNNAARATTHGKGKPCGNHAAAPIRPLRAAA
jgi:hypothetical protein